MIYRNFLKRILDIIFSILLIVLLIPVMLCIGFLLLLVMGKPVLFNQERPGHKGRIFRIYKFRTMTSEADEKGNLLSGDDRLTGLGKFLRALSLDELPELFNILKGEMSFVGPRPLLKEYLHLYTKKQMKRHDVKPGLTGLAQVNGRNELDWSDRFRKDLEYIENVSFLLDFKILLKTFMLVIKREGISSGTSKTMETFTGCPD